MLARGTIAVLGANGRTGRAVVSALLAAGYAVKAGVHRSSEHVPKHPLVEIQTCNVYDETAISRLLRGTEAALSTLGHNRHSGPDVQTVAMQHIVRTRAQHEVRRVISLTGTGVRQPGDTPDLLDMAINSVLGLVAPARMKDGHDHAMVLKTSDLAWTVLRVFMLTGGTKQPYGFTPNGPALRFVSRATVAHAFVRALSSERYIARLPIISPFEAATVHAEEPATVVRSS